MELVHLHVHQRDAPAEGKGDAVAGACESVRGHAEYPAEAARGDKDGFRMDRVELAGLDLVGDDAAALAVIGEEDVDQVVLAEEVDVVLDAPLVEGLDNHVAGTARRVRGAPQRALTHVEPGSA